MTNAYQRRLERRAHYQREKNKLMSQLILEQKHRIMQDYESTVKEVLGRIIKVTYKNGWYSVGSSKVREPELIQQTRSLQARKHEEDMIGSGNVD